MFHKTPTNSLLVADILAEKPNFLQKDALLYEAEILFPNLLQFFFRLKNPLERFRRGRMQSLAVPEK